MRIVGRRSGASVPQRPRHPEVNQESASRLEPNDQILAATADRRDTLALEAARDRSRIVGPRQPRIRHLDALEAPPFEQRCELAPDGLDLGQLGHGDTLVVRLPLLASGHSITSSSTGCAVRALSASS